LAYELIAAVRNANRLSPNLDIEDTAKLKCLSNLPDTNTDHNIFHDIRWCRADRKSRQSGLAFQYR
jgi:hypothetical protein